MIKDIVAIDVHSHINHGSRFESTPNSKYYNATLEYLLEVNKSCNIGKMLCSTFASVSRKSTEDIELENEYLLELSQKVDPLYQWVVIDPRNDNTYKQAERMLKSKKCVGIKLQSESHHYRIEDYGDEIFSFANEHSAIVLIHPEKGPDYILPFADKYSNATFVMAHMGTWGDDFEGNAIEFSKHNNIYLDTSGSASTQNRVVEEVVSRVGSERILFGTDTYAGGFQRGRIEYALISEKDKENILRNNAEKLFEKNFK